MAIGFGASDLYSDTRALARRKLSPAGFAVVDDMLKAAEDHRALWRAASDKEAALLHRFQDVELRAEGIQRQVDDGYNQNTVLADGSTVSRFVKLPEKAPEVIAIRKELAERRGEWEKQTAIANERGAVVRSFDQLLQGVSRYLDAVAVDKLDDAPEPAKPKPKDISLPAIEAARSKIGSLKAERDANMAAPVAVGQRKREAAAMVAHLADCGIPRLFDLAAGTPAFEFPTLSIMHTAVGAVPGTRDVVTTQGHVNVPDALSVLAWLFPTELQAAIEREIDLAGDDDAAVTDEVRAERDAEIRAQLLDAERAEEMLVRAATAAGLTILRRPGADVRAVLNITGPDPAKL